MRPLALVEAAVKKPVSAVACAARASSTRRGLTCPMNCPNTLRHGPWGGVRPDGGWEVKPEMRCVWLQAVERFVAEAAERGLPAQAALIPSICLTRSPAALRRMDEKVPGISIPAATIERCERAADPEAESFEVACELADHARSLPGAAGLHLISFRRVAGIARLCERLGIPTRRGREASGYRRPVAV